MIIRNIFLSDSCYSVAAQASQLLDVQRQQLPFGADIFPIPPRMSNETAIMDDGILGSGLEIDLPKIAEMADSNTDDGSVISRHYSATLVESAWRNRLNNSTLAYLLESTTTDTATLSLFAASYVSAVFMMALSRKHLV